MDPERTEAQAEALLATRRILARLKLEPLEPGEDLAGELTPKRTGSCSRTTRSGAPKTTYESLLSGTAL